MIQQKKYNEVRPRGCQTELEMSCFRVLLRWFVF